MKINVGLICGGQSPEHEISLFSAKNVEEAMDKHKYNLFIIKIEKNGVWKYDDQELCLIPGAGKNCIGFKNKTHKNLNNLNLDIIFPILHGTKGEDGTIQGLLELCGIPYVGSGVLGSSINMDKDVTKRLLKEAGIRVVDFLVFYAHEKATLNYEVIFQRLGSPFFMKPCNAGSSLGICKIKSEDEFNTALENIFEYDEKIIFEKYIPGREIECAVLGNHELATGVPGEIIPHHEFYSYEAKYFDENGATVEVPAKLAPDIANQIKEVSIRAFKILCCKGMARVDFFLTADGTIYLNEINTLPGFTNISMYPKSWAAAGLSYTDLITTLIELGLENHR